MNVIVDKSKKNSLQTNRNITKMHKIETNSQNKLRGYPRGKSLVGAGPEAACITCKNAMIEELCKNCNKKFSNFLLIPVEEIDDRIEQLKACNFFKKNGHLTVYPYCVDVMIGRRNIHKRKLSAV